MSWNGLNKLLPLLWAGAVLAGFGTMLCYESRPEAERAAALAARPWPAQAPLPLLAGRGNLVMFVHPRCPCTRASLAEAVTAVTRAGGPSQLTLTVLFTLPSGELVAWEDSDLWRTASALPGVRVAVDPDGKLAARFGAVASGHTLFFDPSGQLRFSGGLTAMRGQEGENLGLNEVIALARGVAPALPIVEKTPVYGCILIGPPATALTFASPGKTP